jgi:hypothetical protein
MGSISLGAANHWLRGEKRPLLTGLPVYLAWRKASAAAMIGAFRRE